MKMGALIGHCLIKNQDFQIDCMKMVVLIRSLSYSREYLSIFGTVSLSGFKLARVPRVPGTHGIFRQEYLAPPDFGNFTI